MNIDLWDLLKAQGIQMFSQWANEEYRDPASDESYRQYLLIDTITSALQETDLATVRFDRENLSHTPDEFKYDDSGALVGEQVINGVPFIGVLAGGDWEAPVFYILYERDGVIKGFIPLEGNVFNTKTMEAYGNDFNADGLESEMFIDRGTTDVDFEWDKIKLAIGRHFDTVVYSVKPATGKVNTGFVKTMLKNLAAIDSRVPMGAWKRVSKCRLLDGVERCFQISNNPTRIYVYCNIDDTEIVGYLVR